MRIIYNFGPTAEVTTSAFETMYGTNIRAPMLLAARLAPAMMQR